jgi:3'(2'), 5'-bisphosphate nucleotidase
MSAAFSQELLVGITAIKQAARLCREVRADLAGQVLEKDDRSPVTVADFASQAVVCAALRDAFPGDPMVAEEDFETLAAPQSAPVLSAVLQQVQKLRPEVDARLLRVLLEHERTSQRVGPKRKSRAGRLPERFWTLDPIDGTKGFLRGGQYAISLALIVDGKVEVAILGCPNLPLFPRGAGASENAETGTLFFAVRGQGASMQTCITEAEASPPIAIHVSGKSDPKDACFCESVEAAHSSHGDAAAIAGKLGIAQPPLRMDSQAKYAVLARGDAELYLRMPTRPDYREKIWDHAGGMLILTEAGGRVTDLHGKPLQLSHGAELVENSGIVASNGRLHEKLLSAIRGGV